MTTFDLLLLAIIGVSIFFAAVRGAVRELATLAVLVFAAAVAWGATKPVLALAGEADRFLVGAVVALAAGIGVFLVAYFMLHKAMLRLKLSKNMKRYDRIGGGAFGLLRALALIGLGFLGYGYYLDEENQPEAVRKALLLPVAAASAGFFEQFAPSNRELNAPAKRSTNAAVEGYANVDRSGLKEIVATVTTTERREAEPSDDPIAGILAEDATNDEP